MIAIVCPFDQQVSTTTTTSSSIHEVLTSHKGEEYYVLGVVVYLVDYLLFLRLGRPKSNSWEETKR